MKRWFSTLVFFLISLAIFSLANALAKENSDISSAIQSEGDNVVEPEWWGWGWRRPLPWGRPLPKWPIPGRGGALPPLPSHKFPPLPPKGSGSDTSNTEEHVEIGEQAESIEQDDDVYQPEWLGWGRRPYYPRPRPGFGIYPRPGFPRPYHPIPRYPFPGWGAHPPRPSP